MNSFLASTQLWTSRAVALRAKSGRALWSIGLLSLVPCCVIADQNLAGNVTITGGAATGNLSVTGAIDSDGNALTFGTQGASFGAALQYQDSSTDTFTFSTNRNPASWLWLHSAAVPAMRLDASHQLILYQADGTTAGVTFTPANNSIKLGTHASGTLTADANGVITAGGGFAVAGGITNTSGALVGGASGLSLNAGGTNQDISLNSTGGDLIFSTGSTERMRIKANGRVGIGAANPSYLLHLFSSANSDQAVVVQNPNIGPSARAGFQIVNSSGSAASILLTGGGYTGVTGWTNRMLVGTDSSIAGGMILRPATGGLQITADGSLNNPNLFVNAAGNVGIGTTNPAGLLHLYGTNPSLLVEGNGITKAGLQIKTNGIVRWDISSPSASSDLRFNNGSTDVITIQNSGYVGLGAAPIAQRRLGVYAPTALNLAADFVEYAGVHSVTIRPNNGGYNTITSNYLSGSSYLPLALTARENTTDLVLDASGNVGIGTNSPQANLDVTGPDDSGVATASAIKAYSLNRTQYVGLNFLGLNATNRLIFNVNGGTEAMRIDTAGNVGIGTTNPTHRLAVNGTIRAKEVIVDTGWADYVFEEDYRLAPLAEVETHIKAKGHLPGIPSAAEVAEHGVSMGDMQARLLAKVEELTLHLIAQEKRNNAQQAEIATLRAELTSLTARAHP